METIFQSVNPATQSALHAYTLERLDVIHNKIEGAAQAFKSWKKVPLEEKKQAFLRMSTILKNQRKELALLMTQEMGKPIKQSLGEIAKCAWLCEYYAENAADFLKPKTIQTEQSISQVVYQPLGVILEIMPWNFPFWQVFRCAVPTMLVGNTVLLKHAPNVSACALKIQELFVEASFPEHTFQYVLADVDQVQSILEHPAVQGVALTGSLRAGKAVGALAGQNIKKCVLELGGSDPFVVLADANLEKAAKAAVQSRMHNSGQTCISAKRFIVEQSVADTFLTLVKKEIEALRIGDPLDLRTDLSAMARPDLVEKLQEQFEVSVEMGAHIELMGGRMGNTNYFKPAILSNLSKGMPAYDDELFGPLIALFTVDNIQEAIDLANDSIFGLGASVWTNDEGKAILLAQEIETGNVAINQVLRSDPRVPFGGIKQSGFGRELGKEGMLEFVNIKSINKSIDM